MLTPVQGGWLRLNKDGIAVDGKRGGGNRDREQRWVDVFDSNSAVNQLRMGLAGRSRLVPSMCSSQRIQPSVDGRRSLEIVLKTKKITDEQGAEQAITDRIQAPEQTCHQTKRERMISWATTQ